VHDHDLQPRADTRRADRRHTVSTLPAGETVQKGYSTAEIRVHPSGRFVYGSNRGHDTIAVFSLDEDTGRLTPVQHEPTQGSTPRNFNIDPGGRWLLAANQRSHSVVVFRIDQETGRLTPPDTRSRWARRWRSPSSALDLQLATVGSYAGCSAHARNTGCSRHGGVLLAAR
jgi:6-phosphogluconolactonase (cycloisomerase 2 family)